MSAINNHRKLAVLIDADNIQAALAKSLIEEVAKHGIATIKRAYGDWTSTHLKGWKEHLHIHAIQPIQQFSYTNGKNSTDSALIIDAMDLLYASKVNGFCLVSSDSDLTRLATRLREAGMFVCGLGRQNTPTAFVAACDQFTYIDAPSTPLAAVSSHEPGESKDLTSILKKSIRATRKDDGWAPLTAVSSYLRQLQPSFNPKNHGFSTLGKLVKSQSYIAVREVSGHWTVSLKSA